MSTIAEMKVALQTRGVNVPASILAEIKEMSPPGINGGIIFGYLGHNEQKTALYTAVKNEDSALKVTRRSYNRYSLDIDPNFYISFDIRPDIHETDIDGMPFHRVAGIYPNGHLDFAATHYCYYFDDGNQCKFCTIGEWSNASGPGRNRIAKAAKLASDNLNNLHISITTGTLPTIDRGASAIISLANKFLQHEVRLPYSVETEPVPPSYVDEMHALGATTICSNVEFLDEQVRRMIMPLKGEIEFEQYVKHWQKCVDTFGVNQVFTNVLISPLDVNFKENVVALDRITDLGVIPSLAPMRMEWTNPDVMKDVGLPEYQYLYDLHVEVTEMLLKKGLNPNLVNAGCHRNGCYSALRDFYNEAKDSNIL